MEDGCPDGGWDDGLTRGGRAWGFTMRAPDVNTGGHLATCDASRVDIFSVSIV